MEQETKNESKKLSIPMAIIIVGVLISGAILLKDAKPKTEEISEKTETVIPKISNEDQIIGDKNAKVVLVMYEDFQCPFCAAVSGKAKSDSPVMKYLKNVDPEWTAFMPYVLDTYVKSGQMAVVYRDWAFLGQESIRAAEAGRCAGEQGKFWEYYDYLYSNQAEENSGAFSDEKLKSFARNINLNTNNFDQCLDSKKYYEAVIKSKNDGANAGIKSTPEGILLKNGKVVDTIKGAESLASVKVKIEKILK